MCLRLCCKGLDLTGFVTYLCEMLINKWFLGGKMSNELLFSRLNNECQVRTAAGAKSYRNVRTALNSFKKFGHGLTLDSLYEKEELESLKIKIANAMQAKGKSKATIHSVRSNLSRLSELAKEVAPKNQQPMSFDTKGFKTLSFGEALRKTLEYNYPDKTVTDCSLEIHRLLKDTPFAVSQWTVRTWIHMKSTPSSPMLDKVKAIEELLGVTDGALSSKVSLPPMRKKNPPKRKFQETIELPKHLEDQLRDLARFYTHSEIPAERETLFDDEIGDMILVGGSKWRTRIDPVSNKEYSPTNLTFVRNCTSYFSWLHLNHGIPKEELDLSLLFYDKLFLHYLIHTEKQGGGVHKVTKLIDAVVSGMSHDNRYLTRYHVPSKAISHNSKLIKAQYKKGLPVYDNYVDWVKVRPVILNNLKKTAKDGDAKYEDKLAKGDTKKIGGKSNIGWILKHEKGVRHVVENELWSIVNYLGRPLNSATFNIEHNRVAAWLALELVTPLRIGNTLEIKLIDNRYVDTDTVFESTSWLDAKGNFRVYVPQVLLKNWTNQTNESIDITIPKRSKHFKIIKTYLESRDNLLKKRGVESEYLFGGILGEKTGQPVAIGSLGNSISMMTHQAMLHLFGKDDCANRNITSGINPHAMRHIVAQYLLELHPNDYALAAHALMDSVDTIIKEYGSNNHTQQRTRLEKTLFG